MTIIIYYKFCKECYQFSPPHCFRGSCATHKNEVCSGCWDKFALGRFYQGRVSATAQCIQCARQISERELENRLSSTFYLEYIGKKYKMAIARSKEPKGARKPAEDDGEDDFVMVEMDDAQTGSTGDTEDGKKEESKAAQKPTESESQGEREKEFVMVEEDDAETD
ncbi:hypothetical protein CERZMDRAFT_100428 [Cercospora zeae-maydis SCOH1-5]|uniref:Uncharacterized protein n=1 Tax=Cercospora zeae-maydis SCOH1-5 TaxID=717836 RepID=A0A6A6F6Q7_9PEZI|nr:hypothetical protein CERZMDRAFT_100428 [Cercospora zeae-maydis SCOH1-5]